MDAASSGLPAPPASIVDVATESKRLNDRLAEVEQYLSSLAWKVDASVQDGDLVLAFERKDRGWALIVREKYFVRPKSNNRFESIALGFNSPEERWSETLLRDASIPARAKAAGLIPKLMRKIREEYDTKVKNLAAGHAALDSLDQILKADKEGV